MKKKYFLLILFVLFLSGCTQSEISLKINEDKSIIAKNTVLFNKDVVNEKAEPKDITKEYNRYENIYKEKNFKVKKIENNKHNGLSIEKKVKNINELQKETGDVLTYDVSSKRKKSLFYDTYNIEIKIDGIFISGDVSRFLPIGHSEHKATFKIETPYKSNSYNATKAEGKSLEWELKSDQENVLNFSYNHYHSWVKYTLYGFGVFILLLIILFTIKKIRNRY